MDAGLNINWKAAIVAGLIAGLVFLVLEMLMVPLFMGGSPWGPPRMIGAIGIGQSALPPPATFSLPIVAVAIIVHFVLSVIYAVVLAFIIDRLDVGMAMLAGAVFGLVLYIVNFYGFTAIFPWFVNARNWVTIFTHIVFGFGAAWVYKALLTRRGVEVEHA